MPLALPVPVHMSYFPELSYALLRSSAWEKNIMSAGGGARRLSVSPGQAFVLRQHPLCRPMEFETTAKTCDLSCDAITNEIRRCRSSCNKNSAVIIGMDHCGSIGLQRINPKVVC